VAEDGTLVPEATIGGRAKRGGLGRREEK